MVVNIAEAYKFNKGIIEDKAGRLQFALGGLAVEVFFVCCALVVSRLAP